MSPNNPSLSYKDTVYSLLRPAHLNASELIAHRDRGVSRLGREIKHSLNQCLEFVRVHQCEASTSTGNTIADGVKAHQLIARACVREVGGVEDNACVTIRCDADTKVMRHASELLLVLRELCQNAFDATKGRDNPEVTIAFVYENGVGKFTIEDNGTGIKTKVLDRLFPTLMDRKAEIRDLPLSGGLDCAIRIARSINARVTLMRTGPAGTKFAVTPSPMTFSKSAPAAVRNAPAELKILSRRCASKDDVRVDAEHIVSG